MHAWVLQATWAPYQLPSAIAGAAVASQRGRLLIAGGATGRGTPTSDVSMLNPVTGQDRPASQLAEAVAGASTAPVHGRLLLFGGRGRQSVDAVQPVGASGMALASARMRLARLPQARAGLVAVTAGPATYLVGGTNGAGPMASVLKTTDGSHYSVAASLPVPASDTAAVAAAGDLWVFGGMTSAGPTNVIQRVDLRTGRAKVVGRLLAPVADESAFVLAGRIYLAGGLTRSATGHLAPSSTVLSIDPADAGPASGGTGTGVRVRVAGRLPGPVAYAASAVVHGTAYLVGGTSGGKATPAVVTLRLVPARQALPGTTGASPGLAPWLAPAHGPGYLAPGSDPSALPADVLVADHLNNRLVIIDPQGRIRWVFPRPGDLARGQTFLVPDDAFFSPDGRYIVATQEDDQLITVIDVATRKIVYRYGKAGTPGSGPDRVDNPDDAMMMPNGDIIAADIKNCRIIVIAPPAHRPLRVIGRSPGGCWHEPPAHFGSPNGAFPDSGGGYVVTEINGDWADGLNLAGKVRWATNPPGVYYPSDTNEVYPGRYLTVDYSDPGQVVEFSSAGRLLWRYGGLDKPSLAIPLPSGYILLNDDFNHRIIVVDPAKDRVVWQYGHKGRAGRAPGYLNDPDGLDLVPPDSFLIRHSATMRQP